MLWQQGFFEFVSTAQAILLAACFLQFNYPGHTTQLAMIDCLPFLSLQEIRSDRATGPPDAPIAPSQQTTHEFVNVYAAVPLSHTQPLIHLHHGGNRTRLSENNQNRENQTTEAQASQINPCDFSICLHMTTPPIHAQPCTF